MRNLYLAFSAAAFALVTATAGAAFADVAPPDECAGTSVAGMACSNAGPNADQPGVCTNEMCPHTGPGADGGITTTENPCLLCEPSSTTATGAGGSTASGSTTTGAGGSTASSSGGTSGGCAVGNRAGDGMIAGTMLMVGLGVLLADRRRRRG